jgi:hypothetical protein
MPDAETLTLALTFTGTLAVAALMFLGQLAAFTVLLALAGIVRLLTLPVAARTRRKKPTPTEHARSTKCGLAADPGMRQPGLAPGAKGQGPRAAFGD